LRVIFASVSLWIMYNALGRGIAACHSLFYPPIGWTVIWSKFHSNWETSSWCISHLIHTFVLIFGVKESCKRFEPIRIWLKCWLYIRCVSKRLNWLEKMDGEFLGFMIQVWMQNNWKVLLFDLCLWSSDSFRTWVHIW